MGSEKKSKITLRGADVSYCVLSSPVPLKLFVSLCVCHSSVRVCVCVAQAQNHSAGLQKESTHVGGGGGRRSGLCLHVACRARARSSLRRLTGYYGYSLL